MSRLRPGRAGAAAPVLPARALLALALLVPACDRGAGEPAPAPAEHPLGTVLAVDGVPILAGEVDRWAAVTALLEPDKVAAHQRRLALANVVLPLRAAEALDPEGRRRAFARISHLRGLATELGRIPDDAERRDVAAGTWRQVGLVDWEVARGLEVGQWSEVYETPGGWAFLRLLERDAPVEPGETPSALSPRETGVRFERVHVFYLDPEGVRTVLDEALRALPIEIVDPEWERYVPPIFLQHAVSRTP